MDMFQETSHFHINEGRFKKAFFLFQMVCPEIPAAITRMMKIFLLTFWKNNFSYCSCTVKSLQVYSEIHFVFIHWNLFSSISYVYIYLKKICFCMHFSKQHSRLSISFRQLHLISLYSFINKYVHLIIRKGRTKQVVFFLTWWNSGSSSET